MSLDFRARSAGDPHPRPLSRPTLHAHPGRGAPPPAPELLSPPSPWEEAEGGRGEGGRGGEGSALLPLLFVLSVLLLACEPTETPPPPSAGVPVRSEVVEPAPFRPSLTLLGRVEPASRVEVRAAEAGTARLVVAVDEPAAMPPPGSGLEVEVLLAERRDWPTASAAWSSTASGRPTSTGCASTPSGGWRRSRPSTSTGWRGGDGDDGDDDPVIRGTRRVALPLLAGFLATAVVFLPLIYMRGLARAFFGVQAFAIVTTLAVSLALSLTLVPVLARRLARGGGPAAGRSPGRERYPRLLRSALDRPAAVVAAALLLLAAAAALLPAPASGAGHFFNPAPRPITSLSRPRRFYPPLTPTTASGW